MRRSGVRAPPGAEVFFFHLFISIEKFPFQDEYGKYERDLKKFLKLNYFADPFARIAVLIFSHIVECRGDHLITFLDNVSNEIRCF